MALVLFLCFLSGNTDIAHIFQSQIRQISVQDALDTGKFYRDSNSPVSPILHLKGSWLEHKMYVHICIHLNGGKYWEVEIYPYLYNLLVKTLGLGKVFQNMSQQSSVLQY